jgi:beta-ribofuranosylaminobenzene 5'-phosphate synthase
MKVKIRTPSRIHISLIDLNGALGRVDGGVGLALEEPFIEIIAEEADESEGVIVEGSKNERYRDVAKKVSSIFNSGGLKLRVLHEYEPHIGLGSGTQISLAVAKAYAEIYRIDKSVEELAYIVGRGGTSGIGVAAFRVGGFVVDGGHSRNEKKDFLPSSASKATPPPLISRLEFPDWKIFLAVPSKKGFYGHKEVNLFQENCPIPLEEVRELAHLILMKLLPSVVEEDVQTFGDALWRIQHLGFKKVEVDQYGEKIWNVMGEAREVFPAVGMSSTGPTVYCISDSGRKKDLESIFKEAEMNFVVFETVARNRGADIERI